MRIATANVIKPIPPNWIKTSKTASPKEVSTVPGSKTLKPVTVVAEVATKIASVHEIGAVVANGNFSSKVPIRIRMKKLPEINNGGEIFLLFLKMAITQHTSFSMKRFG